MASSDDSTTAAKRSRTSSARCPLRDTPPPPPHQSNNRAVDPVEGPILGAVPNLAAPYSALSDGAVHLLEKFLGVVAGVYDAVILAEELFAGVLTDGAE